jgi:hypothetical protein
LIKEKTVQKGNLYGKDFRQINTLLQIFPKNILSREGKDLG